MALLPASLPVLNSKTEMGAQVVGHLCKTKAWTQWPKNAIFNLNDSILYNLMYLGDPSTLPSLLTALKLDGLVTVNHEPCMCMNVSLRALGSPAPLQHLCLIHWLNN